MYINNNLKVTPGEWFIDEFNNIDTESFVDSNGERLTFNIGSVSTLNKDYKQNTKAIIAAVNFFKSIDIESFKEQREALTDTIFREVNSKDKRIRKEAEYLEGILHLTDAIADILIDNFGSDEFGCGCEEE